MFLPYIKFLVIRLISVRRGRPKAGPIPARPCNNQIRAGASRMPGALREGLRPSPTDAPLRSYSDTMAKSSFVGAGLRPARWG